MVAYKVGPVLHPGLCNFLIIFVLERRQSRVQTYWWYVGTCLHARINIYVKVPLGQSDNVSHSQGEIVSVEGSGDVRVFTISPHMHKLKLTPW